MEIIFTLKEIQTVAKQILKEAGHHKCLAFFAEMGAGKTTLINAICRELQVIDNVSSPTYSIINEYKTAEGKSVIHMDWYRLKNADDAENAGVADYIQATNYCLIEWPERAERLLPKDAIIIKLNVLDENTRTCKF